MLWVAPVHAQVVEIYRDLANILKPVITKCLNNSEIHLITKGQIWFRSSDNPATLRSLGYHLVIFDEMAFSTEESWTTIRPLLAEKNKVGEFWGITTPLGHNWFHDLFFKLKNNPDWLCEQKDWSCSPNLDENEIAKARLEMSPSAFAQEFEASFISQEGSIFPADWLQPEKIFVDKFPDSPQRICIFADLSLGKITSDFQGVCLLAKKDGIFYCKSWALRLPPTQLVEFLAEKYNEFKPEFIGFETNGFQQLIFNDFRIKCPSIPVVPLQQPNQIKKETRISRLSTLLSQSILKIVDDRGGRILYNQLCDFPNGEFDDCPDALQSAWECLIKARI